MKTKLTLVFLLISFVGMNLGYYNEYGFNNGQFSEDDRQLYELYDRLNGLKSFEEAPSPDIEEENERQKNDFEVFSNNELMEEEEEPNETVDKNKISETIEEDQEIRRINDSKNDQKNNKLQNKNVEAGQYATANKEGNKSEKTLPFYCHPPNPCPKGMDEKDGCMEFIQDTVEYQKEWILQSQKKGLCQCDEDHMFDCKNNNVAVGGGSDMEVVLENLAKKSRGDNPFTKGGVKRQSLVAKKLPRFKRDLEYASMEKELARMKKSLVENPYLVGSHLHTVAKKG